MVLHEYLVLMESRILLKLVLGGVIILALSISSHGQTQLNVAKSEFCHANLTFLGNIVGQCQVKPVEAITGDSVITSLEF